MATTTPLHEWTRERGAAFREWFSWLVARDFGDLTAEYEAVRGRAALFDVSYLGKLRVTGRDRVRFLHSLLSNDIRGLGVGQGCHATLLTRQGRMESDLFVYADADQIWLECPPAGTSRITDTLRKHVIADQVDIEARTEELAIVSLQGPQAHTFLRVIADCAGEQLPELGHRLFGEPQEPRRIVRRDRTGCGGFDLWLPAAEAAAVWNRLAGDAGLRPAGHDALDILRTEAGIPWYGVDMGESNLPMEFGLDRAISLTKGCYRGQEIVARVTHRGHLDRRLGGIALATPGVPSRGAGVFAGGSKVGEVTSAVHSLRLARPLALAVMKLEVLSPGAAVEVEAPSGRRPGVVTALPLPS